MQVLMVVDPGFARFERGMIARLVVGLVDDGVDVIVAWPEGEAPAEMLEAAAWVIPIPMSLPMPSALLRRRLIRRRMRDAGLEEGEGTVDVVHAFGGAAWGVAQDLARDFRCVLAVEMWRSGMATRLRMLADAQRTRRRGEVGAGGGESGGSRGTLAFVPDDALERDALDTDAPMIVRVAPWGVHGGVQGGVQGVGTEGTAHDAGRVRSVALIGNGRDGARVVPAFESLLRLCVEREDLMLVADAGVVRRLRLWKRVSAASAEKFVTLHPGIEHARDAVLRCDVVVHPESRGERRSLLLDAMASGSAVVAAADGRVPWLIEGQTARVVSDASGPAWQKAVSGVLDDTRGTAALAASARAFVREHHRVSSHVSAVIDGYEWAVSGTPTRLVAAHAGLSGAGDL